MKGYNEQNNRDTCVDHNLIETPIFERDSSNYTFEHVHEVGNDALTCTGC